MIDINFDKEVEKAIKFLVYAIDKSGYNPKPVILHSIRVGLYLKNHKYNKNIVIEAILHDLLEDTDTTIKEIKQAFGEEVATMIGVNTFDKAISNKTEQYKDVFNRCLKKGKEALIIKAADILDNSHYYHLAENKELTQHLFQKMKYFIDLSEPVLKSEIVYEDLKRQYHDLVNS
jgi:(p)ppGpp synthase/HD superfamily hydrolase